MTEDESDFESSRFGAVDFDYTAVDPEDVLAVYRRAAAFMESITATARTPKSAQIKLAVATWMFRRDRESVSAIARRLGVSRIRIHQVMEELTRAKNLK